MNVLRVLGVFSVVPATMLITASFFVMFVLSKVEKSSLRIFGMVAVALLLIGACIVLSTGIFLVAQEAEYPGYHSMAKSCLRSYPSMMGGSYGMMINPHSAMMKGPQSGLMQGKGFERMRQDMMEEYSSGQK
ncbi:MAG: hypothetical protein ABIH27_01240 [Candidatus Omnitrophota bacterium]